MPWFKVDDRLTIHLKYLSMDPSRRCEAMGLWVQAGSWSSLNLLDGYVPADVLGHFGTDCDVADVLVEAGYWASVEGGYQFVNWAEFQPLRSHSEDKKSKEAERKRRWREQKRDDSADVPVGQSGTDRPSASVQPPRPDPSRPDPLKKRAISEAQMRFEDFWAVYPKRVAKK